MCVGACGCVGVCLGLLSMNRNVRWTKRWKICFILMLSTNTNSESMKTENKRRKACMTFNINTNTNSKRARRSHFQGGVKRYVQRAPGKCNPLYRETCLTVFRLPVTAPKPPSQTTCPDHSLRSPPPPLQIGGHAPKISGHAVKN